MHWQRCGGKFYFLEEGSTLLKKVPDQDLRHRLIALLREGLQNRIFIFLVASEGTRSI